ncbi:MAG TPA: 4Fe-4S binding protein [Anaeromyxobacteraceae bacterium]|nr:4Fe-4S binding protein [Anaeromyxobacteraceae bacterium]
MGWGNVQTDQGPDAAPPPLAAARWRNPWRSLPKARWAVQGAYVLFLVWVGLRFAAFVDAALADGPIAAHRPPAVEAFLPIAALLAAKRFLLTGYWDPIHPAGLTILLGAVATALLARKAFCSWICPVGTLSRGLEWLGRRTLWRRGWPAVPRWLDLPLASIKYLLLAFFVRTVAAMPLDAVEEFLRAPYNVAADAKMLQLFRGLSLTAGIVLGALALLSLLVKHLWCRYLCPYGALLGLASLLSPLRVRRDPATCNDCRACTRACPVEIPVHARLRVLSPECTGCMSCVAACTVPDCLGVTREGRRAWSPWLVPAVALAVMLGAWAVARATGFWETETSPEVFRWAYRLVGIR